MSTPSTSTRLLHTLACAPLLVCAALTTTAHAQETPPDASTAKDASISGFVRALGEDKSPVGAGSGTTLSTELRAQGKGWNLIGTAQQQYLQGQSVQGQSWFNELAFSHDVGAWSLSAGKKIVSWDVGYGFRPNDMVQQEVRRNLIETTPEGRPLVMAEHFDANSAYTLVWVNPSAERDAPTARESALALRYYRRAGSADWYAFARTSKRNGTSLGAALAWVASDALELHASLRHLPSAGALPGEVAHGDTQQTLLGGTWTHSSQLSVLLEMWWDGSARWSTQRRNTYARVSWEYEAWTPALDVLYQDADGGMVSTASLTYKGNRTQVQAGVRRYQGPADAIIMQQSLRQHAFVALTWSF